MGEREAILNSTLWEGKRKKIIKEKYKNERQVSQA